MKLRWIVALLASTLILGCSAEPTQKSGPPIVIGDDAGTEPDTAAPVEVVVTAGEVTITASVAQEVSGIGGVSADGGNILVVVPVAVANGLDQAIPVGYTLFRLRTGALERLPSEGSANVEAACPVDALLAAGTIVECIVVFEIPESAEPSALIFQALDQTLETAVALQACTRCGGGCVNLATSASHCGACNTEIPTGGECIDGEPTCPDGRYLCEDYCTRNDIECFVQSTRQVSCSVICDAAGLRCSKVDYYYTCSETEGASHPDLGCDDQPPRTWDACGTYSDMDCRCLPQ